jgi:uncharacterized damage-inducible protein DinB
MSNTKIQILTSGYSFNRSKTLELLAKVEQLPHQQEALGWRPGPGRAHIAWQIMHVAITEEIFATERLASDRKRDFEDLWARYRSGSTPDDTVPTIAAIREVLEKSRQHMMETLLSLKDDQLDQIPPAMAARGFTLETILQLIGFHEAHHQGQAHITLNLYKAAHGIA